MSARRQKSELSLRSSGRLEISNRKKTRQRCCGATLLHTFSMWKGPDAVMPLWTYRHLLDVGQELFHCCGRDAHVFKHPFQLCSKVKTTFCLWANKRKKGGLSGATSPRTEQIMRESWTCIFLYITILPWVSGSCSSLCLLTHSCCPAACSSDAACSTFQIRPSPAGPWITSGLCPGRTPPPVLSADLKDTDRKTPVGRTEAQTAGQFQV